MDRAADNINKYEWTSGVVHENCVAIIRIPSVP